MKFLALVAVVALAATAQVMAAEVTLDVYHKLSDHESFEKRGQIVINTDSYQSTFVSLPGFGSKILPDFTLNVQAPATPQEPVAPPTEIINAPEVDPVTGENLEGENQDQGAEATEEDGMPEMPEIPDIPITGPGSYHFYQIKIKDEARGWEAHSSIKSCLLVASGFQDAITLHLDQHLEVYAFDYYTPSSTDSPQVSTCSPTDKRIYNGLTLDHFKTNVNVQAATLGPKATYIRAQTIKLDPTGKPAAEQTFFQKYWMMFAIVGLFFLFTTGEPEKK